MEQNEAYKRLAAKINNLSNEYEQTGNEEKGEGIYQYFPALSFIYFSYTYYPLLHSRSHSFK